MNTDENNGVIGATAVGLKADASATTRVAISPPGLEAREGKNTEAELRQLQLLVEQLRGNEIEIQRRNDLLEGLIEYLPVSLSVQDEQGQLVVINGAAGIPGSPEELDPANDLTEIEENISGPAGERTLLT